MNNDLTGLSILKITFKFGIIDFKNNWMYFEPRFKKYI